MTTNRTPAPAVGNARQRRVQRTPMSTLTRLFAHFARAH